MPYIINHKDFKTTSSLRLSSLNKKFVHIIINLLEF